MTRRKRLTTTKRAAGTLAIFATLAQVLTGFSASSFVAGTIPGNLTFQNTALTRPEGDVEPAISIDSDGTMAITGLQRLAPGEIPNVFGTHYWSGPFGSTPTFRGLLDADLRKPGKTVIGSGDGDVDLGSTGTLHATSNIFLINSAFKNDSVGISAITCTDSTASNCTSQIIDTAGADRQWITSDGSHVYIAYHDAGFSGQIHVQRSDDDGYTWTRAGNPIGGQGPTTGDAILKNVAGPIVADPLSHNVYTIYAAASEAAATNIILNNILVSRSTDGGNSWTANLAYHAPSLTSLNNIFPSLAVDPTNGKLYATWADPESIFFSSSSDQGDHWSPPVKVNIAPANTCLFPWVAAYNGTVDVVYYATTASSKDDEAAVWNVYIAQTTNDGVTFAQSKVSNTPNHMGAVCTEGSGCSLADRGLWDLFEVAIDPQNGRAAVIYTDTNTGDPKAQVVLATQN